MSLASVARFNDRSGKRDTRHPFVNQFHLMTDPGFQRGTSPLLPTCKASGFGFLWTLTGTDNSVLQLGGTSDSVGAGGLSLTDVSQTDVSAIW